MSSAVFSEGRKERRRYLETRLKSLPFSVRDSVKQWLIDILNENRGLPLYMLEGQLYYAAEALGAKMGLDGLAGQYYFACPYCGGDFFGEEDFHATTECAVEEEDEGK